MQNAVVLSRSDTINVRDLPQNIRVGDDKELGGGDSFNPSDLTVKEAEKQLIIRALKETNGNRSEAAKKIGMSRRTMHR